MRERSSKSFRLRLLRRKCTRGNLAILQVLPNRLNLFCQQWALLSENNKSDWHKNSHLYEHQPYVFLCNSGNQLPKYFDYAWNKAYHCSDYKQCAVKKTAYSLIADSPKNITGIKSNTASGTLNPSGIVSFVILFFRCLSIFSPNKS